MVRWLFQHYLRRAFPARQRAAIDARARELIAAHGDAAYFRARELARESRPAGTRQDPFNARVARRIAKLTGHEIGMSGADRYPAP